MPVRSASFVSLLVDSEAVRAVGLPEADFFLWNDDFEFSTRLLRDRVGLYCPASVVEHRTKAFGSTDLDPGDRFYFEVRNKVWTFTRSRRSAPDRKRCCTEPRRCVAGSALLQPPMTARCSCGLFAAAWRTVYDADPETHTK